LTESQFGLASVKFRWNLSGTYQQVIPRYISTDPSGRDEREFLAEHFPDMERLTGAVFLKGYQWPFDPRKIGGFGSSLIDLLVHRETVVLGRRVFLDFRRNPGGGPPLGGFSFDRISPEAREYLDRSGALLPTPFKRLARMNPPAIELFRSHGLDLEHDPLEVAVCAQHNNGGLAADLWWESNIRHLFPVGEVNGTHGVYRPGGAALNSGQVGSARAARAIARKYDGTPPDTAEFLTMAEARVRTIQEQAERMLKDGAQGPPAADRALRDIRIRMTAHGAHIRDPRTIDRARTAAWRLYRRLLRSLPVAGPEGLPAAFRVLDHALTEAFYLEAIHEYLARGGRSRGSYLVLDPAGKRPCPTLGPEWAFSLAASEDEVNRRILEIRMSDSGRPEKCWTEIRPLPETDAWFENVWTEYRKNPLLR
jgi:hypothetical protein